MIICSIYLSILISMRSLHLCYRAEDVHISANIFCPVDFTSGKVWSENVRADKHVLKLSPKNRGVLHVKGI